MLGKYKYSTKSGAAYQKRMLKNRMAVWKRRKAGQLSFVAKARKAASFRQWKKSFGMSRNLKRVVKKKFRRLMPLRAVKNIYGYLGRSFGKF